MTKTAPQSTQLDESTGRTKRLRFSLRTLLILMSIACGLAAWTKSHVDAARAQAAAVKTLNELGFHAVYDHDVVSAESDSFWEWKFKDSRTASWIDRVRAWVGVDQTSNVIAVTAFEDGSNVEPSDFERCAVVQSLPRLRVIDVFESCVSVDDLLAHCKDHRELVSISITNMLLTDEFLDRIGDLPQIRTLSLGAVDLRIKGRSGSKGCSNCEASIFVTQASLRRK